MAIWFAPTGTKLVRDVTDPAAATPQKPQSGHIGTALLSRKRIALSVYSDRICLMIRLLWAALPSSGRVLFPDGSILSRRDIFAIPGCQRSWWSPICSDYHRFTRQVELQVTIRFLRHRKAMGAPESGGLSRYFAEKLGGSVGERQGTGRSPKGIYASRTH